MRYDTPVYFQKDGTSTYNTATGDWVSPVPTETEVYASVLPTKVETLKLVYGKIVQGSLTISIQNYYTEPFDRIRIGNKLYDVDYSRNLWVKQSFVVHEVK